jgi:hypothetical protein
MARYPLRRVDKLASQNDSKAHPLMKARYYKISLPRRAYKEGALINEYAASNGVWRGERPLDGQGAQAHTRRCTHAGTSNCLSPRERPLDAPALSAFRVEAGTPRRASLMP